MNEHTRTYTFADDGPLSLRLKQQSSGDVTVRFDAPAGQATVTLGADRETDFSEIVTAARDGEIQIRIPNRPDAGASGLAWGPFSFGQPRWGVDAEVHLPAEAAVAIETTCGDVTLDGEGGPVSLALGSGDVRVERCAGGSVVTGSGDVLIGDNEGDLRVKLGSGDLRAAHHGGALHAVSGSGDLDVSQDGGSLEGRTGTGDVRVAVPRGVPAWLDLSTATGDVVRDIEPVGAPADGEPYLTVRVVTGTGDVTVCH